MRAFAALSLLFIASCTFDYGALRGTGRDGDAGDDDAGDAGDAIADRPLLPDSADAAADGTPDLEEPPTADADLLAWDSAPDVVADAPLVENRDAAWEAGPVLDGGDASRAKDTEGTGGSSGNGGTTGAGGGGGGGSAVGGSGTGGAVVGGTSDAGGSTASSSTAGTGGTGGTTSTGGTGGTPIDAGADASRDVPQDVAQDVAALETRPDTSDVMRADGAVADASAPYCSPGQAMCVGNATCTCNTAGTGCAATAVACEGESLCNHGACVTPTIDTLAPSPPGSLFSTGTGANVMKVNFYTVDTACTLLKIEQYLSPSAVGAGLTWVVYHSAGRTSGSTYDLVAKVRGSASANTAGYQSSPLLNVPLEVGGSYGIGVYWETSTSYWYHNTVESFPVPVSFGGLIGGMSSFSLGGATLTSLMNSSMYYPQRLSTN